MDKLAVSKIVHFVMSNGEHRPAICVRAWNDTCGNFQVFIDGTNDAATDATREDMDRGVMWATSVCYSEDHTPRTWHWAE
ncbi:MAG: hypothetical protein ACM3TR_11425 [Caulobacteraceae bacterium]